MDIDILQLCSRCDQIELVAEVKDWRAGSKTWRNTRKLGDMLGCASALIVYDADRRWLRWETRGC